MDSDTLDKPDHSQHESGSKRARRLATEWESPVQRPATHEEDFSDMPPLEVDEDPDDVPPLHLDEDSDDDDGFGNRSAVSFNSISSSSNNCAQTLHQVSTVNDGRVHQELMLQAERLRSPRNLLPWETPQRSGWNQQLWERKQWYDEAPPVTAARVLLQTAPPPLPAEVKEKPLFVQPLVRFASKRLRLVKPKVDSDGLRQRALIKWRVIIEQDLLASTIGTMIAAMCENLTSEADIAETLSDVFANKSTATLFKRSNDFCRYIDWATNSLVERPMLCDEHVIYTYMKYLRSIKAAATRPTAFLQALNFSKFTIGLQVPILTLESSRIKGAARKNLLTKRMLKQATPLTVRDMEILEHSAANAECPRDRVASGHYCFETYSSSRHSDANNIEKVHVDIDEDGYGFFEGLTCRHKTATTAEKLTKFLPLIAPAIGVSDTKWGLSWIAAREATNMTWTAPLLPAPNSKGGWTDRPLTAGESTQWLREILLAGGADAAHTMSVSSHSCKATVLSWAAKRGVPISIRRLMGHHVPPGDQSALNYSRDAMSEPLQAVVDILDDIHTGKFDPDAQRSARILPSSRTKLQVARDDPTEVPLGVGSDEERVDETQFDSTELSDSSSSSDGSEDLNSDDLEDGVGADVELVTKLCPNLLVHSSHPDDVRLFQHTSSSVIHYCKDGEGQKLLCGRTVNSGYFVINSFGASLWPVCKQCKPSSAQ